MIEHKVNLTNSNRQVLIKETDRGVEIYLNHLDDKGKVFAPMAYIMGYNCLVWEKAKENKPDERLGTRNRPTQK